MCFLLSSPCLCTTSNQLHHGTTLQACERAKAQGRYLLANIQSHTEFKTHVINRDIWSNPRVRSLVKSNFVLWQVGSSCCVPGPVGRVTERSQHSRHKQLSCAGV